MATQLAYRKGTTYTFQSFSDMPYLIKKEWLNSKRNPIGTVPSNNKIYIADPSDYGSLHIPLHEGEHVYQNKLEKVYGKAYTDAQEKLLNEVYPTDVIPSQIQSSSKIKEKGAVNKEILANIELDLKKQLGKEPSYQELNSYIDQLSSKDLQKYYTKNVSEYAKDYDSNLDWIWYNSAFNRKNWENNFKKALKYSPIIALPIIASNQ